MIARAGRTALIVLDVLIGLVGIGGGVATATGVDPFPQEWIAGTPFNSYLIPGIVLTLAVGGTAAVASVGMLIRAGWGPLASVFAGASMIGFIIGEIIILNQPVEPTVTEVVFLVVGGVMMVLGLAVRRSSGADVTAPGQQAHQPDAQSRVPLRGKLVPRRSCATKSDKEGSLILQKDENHQASRGIPTLPVEYGASLC